MMQSAKHATRGSLFRGSNTPGTRGAAACNRVLPCVVRRSTTNCTTGSRLPVSMPGLARFPAAATTTTWQQPARAVATAVSFHEGVDTPRSSRAFGLSASPVGNPDASPATNDDPRAGISSSDPYELRMLTCAVAMQAGCFQDAAGTMQAAAREARKRGSELSQVELTMLGSAYKSLADPLKLSWLTLRGIEQEAIAGKRSDGDGRGDRLQPERLAIVRGHMDDIKHELDAVCRDVITLVDELDLAAKGTADAGGAPNGITGTSINSASSPEYLAWFLVLKGDFLRSMVEYKHQDIKAWGDTQEAQEALQAYRDALQTTRESVPTTHLVRLTAAICASIFIDTIMERPCFARSIAELAYEEALPDFGRLGEDERRKVEPIMGMLHNIIMQRSEAPEDGSWADIMSREPSPSPQAVTVPPTTDAENGRQPSAANSVLPTTADYNSYCYELCCFEAEIAQAAGRYKQMVCALQDAAAIAREQGHELEEGACEMLVSAYQQQVAPIRRNWSDLEALEEHLKPELGAGSLDPWQLAIVQSYKAQLGAELDHVCQEVVRLVDEHLLVPASNCTTATSGPSEQGQARRLVLFHYLKAEHLRYKCERMGKAAAGSATAAEALRAYLAAKAHALVGLTALDPLRTHLAFNLSTFYNLLGQRSLACSTAQEAYDSAAAALGPLGSGIGGVDRMVLSNIGLLKVMAEPAHGDGGSSDCTEEVN